MTHSTPCEGVCSTQRQRGKPRPRVKTIVLFFSRVRQIFFCLQHSHSGCPIFLPSFLHFERRAAAASRQVALGGAKFATLWILDWTLVSSRPRPLECPSPCLIETAASLLRHLQVTSSPAGRELDAEAGWPHGAPNAARRNRVSPARRSNLSGTRAPSTGCSRCWGAVRPESSRPSGGLPQWPTRCRSQRIRRRLGLVRSQHRGRLGGCSRRCRGVRTTQKMPAAGEPTGVGLAPARLAARTSAGRVRNVRQWGWVRRVHRIRNRNVFVVHVQRRRCSHGSQLQELVRG